MSVPMRERGSAQPFHQNVTATQHLNLQTTGSRVKRSWASLQNTAMSFSGLRRWLDNAEYAPILWSNAVVNGPRHQKGIFQRPL